MVDEQQVDSLNTLRDIRNIMERSARFISLSGWSGVWAGCTALVGSFIAYNWLSKLSGGYYNTYNRMPEGMSDATYNATVFKFVVLAFVVLIVAIIGGYYFTWRKTRLQGVSLWNKASKQMLLQMAIPMIAGAVFAFRFISTGNEGFIAPACLAFYGLALINGSKYTLTDIKYLGLCEVALACICLYMPGYGLTFWAIGFGALHILYGIIMWNKYDKNITKQQAG